MFHWLALTLTLSCAQSIFQDTIEDSERALVRERISDARKLEMSQMVEIKPSEMHRRGKRTEDIFQLVHGQYQKLETDGQMLPEMVKREVSSVPSQAGDVKNKKPRPPARVLNNKRIINPR